MGDCAPRTDDELLDWALEKIRGEQENSTHGVVEVHMQAGRIVRVQIRRTELPNGEVGS